MNQNQSAGISVVVPIYNEIDNIPPLHEQLTAALEGTGREYEIIFVDDGSSDGGTALLAELASRDPRVRAVEFRRNFGQTAAMQAGIDTARYDIVVTLDGDLQNDPADIPMMVAKLEEGYDLVHGLRADRQDALLSRKLPSRIANSLISRWTGFPVRDLGCTLKAMRRDIATELELYGDLHRFIPILAFRRGARCVEVPVRHHPRRHGESKYGIGRTTRVLMDLITVLFLLRYSDRPMRLFGKLAVWCGAISLAAGGLTVGMKLYSGADMTGNPLLTLTVLSTLAGLQFLSLGILGEICARIFYSHSDRTAYAIRRIHECADQPSGLPLPGRRAA